MGRINMEANGKEASGGFPVIDNGEYLFGLKKAIDKVSKSENAYPMTLFICEVIEGGDGSQNGKTMPHNIVWIPKGRPGHGMCLAFLKAIGKPFDGELDFDTDDFIAEGCTFRARIITTKYEGNDQNKVAQYTSNQEEAPAQGDPEPEPESAPEPQPELPSQPAALPAKAAASAAKPAAPAKATPKAAPAKVAAPAGKSRKPFN